MLLRERIFIYRPEKDLPLPENKDPEGNAGWDLHATVTTGIQPGEILKIPVNAMIEIPEGFYGHVTPRSGLSSQGINIISGTIDSNYRGQIHAIVQNVSSETFIIERGMRIAQIIFVKHEVPHWIEVDHPEKLTRTGRGSSGFGNSGIF